MSPRPVEVERSTRASRISAALFGVLLVALATLPFWGGPGDMRLVAEMSYYLALAQLWNLLAGYAGLVSVGQQAFVGLGGYAFFYMTGSLALHPYLALGLVGPLVALLSVPLALIVFRLRGAYVAVGTWVVSEAVIIGGLGSLWGTLIGGMLLGIAQQFGSALSPPWQILAGHIAFLLVLILKPSGLFPRQRDE